MNGLGILALVSRCLSPPRSINEYQEIIESTWQNAEGKPCDGLASQPGREGRVAILLVTLLYKKTVVKVPLTPPNFFLLKKSTSFPDFISEKNISIDKIVAFLQAFEHVISMFTTTQCGIWVGLLVTSLREPS